MRPAETYRAARRNAHIGPYPWNAVQPTAYGGIARNLYRLKSRRGEVSYRFYPRATRRQLVVDRHSGLPL